ncbi:MAG TPA: hypothetical protein VF145_12285 [Chitinophagaceae bacterium]
MSWKLPAAMAILLTASLTAASAQQPTVTKKINVTVTDATTRKPIAGADVRLKGLIVGKLKNKTDGNGMAVFEVYPLATSCTVEVTHGEIHKGFTATITFAETQAEYSVTSAMEQNVKKLLLKATDPTGKAIQYATMTLGSQTKMADRGGNAEFEIPMASTERTLQLTVSHSGFQSYSATISLDNLTGPELTAKLEKQAVSYDMDKPISTTSVGATGTTQSPAAVTYQPATFAAIPPHLKVGPYTPVCERMQDPETAIPSINANFVTQEQSLSGAVLDECLKPINEAIEAMEAYNAFLSQMPKETDLTWDPNNFDQQFKVVDKMSSMVEKIGAFLAEPPVYLTGCFVKGTIQHVVGETAKQTYQLQEGYEDVKSWYEEAGTELEAARTKLNIRQPVTNSPLFKPMFWYKGYKVTSALTDNMGILKNLLLKASDPELLVANDEGQASILTTRAESLIGNLSSTCKIFEAEETLAQAFSKAKEAMMATRLAVARSSNREMTYRKELNDAIGTGYPGLANWETRATDPDPMVQNTVVEQLKGFPAYNDWALAHNNRLAADKKVKRLIDLLGRLDKLCERLTELSLNLNNRVALYLDLYKKGSASAQNCNLEDAKTALAKLKAAERNCSDFLPKYNNIRIYSERLQQELDEIARTKACDKVKFQNPYEKRYGPFEVGLKEWVSTGIQLKKHQWFRVEYDTTSKITYPEQGTGREVRMWPGGHGYWGWFVLAAKLGEDIQHVGATGSGYFNTDGELQLGAPRVAKFFPEDGDGTTGTWRIYVYVTENP